MTNEIEAKESFELSEEILEKFYHLNNQKKAIEKEINSLKKQLHNYFDETFGKEQKGELNLGKYKAQRIIRTTINYDKEKTVQKLEEANLQDFIVLEKRPDTEKLEAAMKIDLVKEEEFADCKKTKLTQAITVKDVG